MKKLLIAAILATQSLLGIEWIDVKKQMPPENERVLFWDENERQMFLTDPYIYVRIMWDDGRDPNITHWSRLPKVPILCSYSPRF